jgi:hypothetical protein
MLERQDSKTLAVSSGAKLRQQGMVANIVDQTPFRAHLGTYYGTWSKTFGPTVWGLLENVLRRKI